jgi:hypothetical protein
MRSLPPLLSTVESVVACTLNRQEKRRNTGVRQVARRTLLATCLEDWKWLAALEPN